MAELYRGGEGDDWRGRPSVLIMGKLRKLDEDRPPNHKARTLTSDE